MRRLSERQARRCEEARGPRCTCRCQGALHGAARLEPEQSPAELPEDDPHFALPPRQRRGPARGQQLELVEMAQVKRPEPEVDTWGWPVSR